MTSEFTSSLARYRSMQARSSDDALRREDQTAKHGFIEGKVSVLCPSDASAGSAKVNVSFPVVFIEEPLFVYGAALDSTEWPDDGDVGFDPQLSGVVYDWEIVERSNDRKFWTGAKINCKVVGWPGMRIFLHYTFSGLSLRNPVFSSLDQEEVL